MASRLERSFSGWNQHQRGRDHRQPDKGSRAADHPERYLGLQAARGGQQPPQGRQSGEWVDKPNYFDVTVWGAQGENCANYLSKGRPVAVEGRLDWREWEAQDGSGKRQAVEIIANASSSSARAATTRAAAAATASSRRPTCPPTPRTSSRPRPGAAAAAAATTSRSSRSANRLLTRSTVSSGLGVARPSSA